MNLKQQKLGLRTVLEGVGGVHISLTLASVGPRLPLQPFHRDTPTSSWASNGPVEKDQNLIWDRYYFSHPLLVGRSNVFGPSRPRE